MTKSISAPPPPDSIPDGPSGIDEIAPAIRDVAYKLTHDLSDTPEDICDAIAFAPLALAKTLDGFASYILARPRRVAGLVAGLLLSLAAVALLRRRRR